MSRFRVSQSWSLWVLTLMALLTPGLATSRVAAQNLFGPPPVNQVANTLLSSVPEKQSGSYQSGMTTVYERAVKIGLANQPRLAAVLVAPRGLEAAVVSEDDADRAAEAGLQSVTGLNVPPDLPIQRAQQNLRVNRFLQAQGIPRLESAAHRVRNMAQVGEELQAADGADPSPGADWFDWRNLSMVPAVSDQGSCGCCWAFGTIGAYESSLAICNTPPNAQQTFLRNVSEQQVLDCSGAGSCGGGWWAFDYLINRGSVGEREAPYREQQLPYANPNAQSPYRADIWGYVTTQNRNGIPSVNELKQALCDHGPLAIAIDATAEFMKYKGGIFRQNPSGYLDAQTGQARVNHAIVLVGWHNDQRAWAIKNSWGSGWGQDGGFAWVGWDQNNVGFGAAWVKSMQISTNTRTVQNRDEEVPFLEAAPPRRPGSEPSVKESADEAAERSDAAFDADETAKGASKPPGHDDQSGTESYPQDRDRPNHPRSAPQGPPDQGQAIDDSSAQARYREAVRQSVRTDEDAADAAREAADAQAEAQRAARRAAQAARNAAKTARAAAEALAKAKAGMDRKAIETSRKAAIAEQLVARMAQEAAEAAATRATEAATQAAQAAEKARAEAQRADAEVQKLSNGEKPAAGADSSSSTGTGQMEPQLPSTTPQKEAKP